MRRKIVAFIVVALVSLALGIIVSPATGLYDMTVRVVSSTGTVLNGTASAVTGLYDKTVRIVNSSNQVIDSFGTSLAAATGITSTGSIQTKVIGQPSAPVVTPTGAATHTYFCVATDLNGSQTAVSAGTTAPGSNPSTITCGGQTGATGYIVLKDATSTGSNKLGSCVTTSGVSCSVTDTGQALTSYTQNGNATDNTGGLYLAGGTNANNDLFVLPLGSGTNWLIQAGSTGGFPTDGGFANGSVTINNVTFPSASALGLQFPSDNAVGSMARERYPSFIDATAATTTIPYGCTLTTKAVIFENVQFTVTSVTQSVAPSLSLCDTGTTANPVACGTTIVNSGTFTAAGNISLTSMTNANVAAAHFVCTFFAAGTATVVIAQATGTARPQ